VLLPFAVRENHFLLVTPAIFPSKHPMPYIVIIIILGIIEGVTEFLPISSTGHLLIAEHILHTHQTDLFNVVIQAGAVLAVIPLFSKRFDQFMHRFNEPATRDYLLKIILAFVITGIGGLILEKKHFKLPEELTPVAWALLIGGILFVIVESMLRGKRMSDDVTWSIAVAVGFGQLIAAIFPGASRSGTTILIALLLGLNRPLATEFSFLVGIPTMLAASGFKIFKALHHPAADAPHEDWGMVILCSVVAAIVSFIAVKWLLRYIQTHTFIAFGWYRIVVGGGLLVFLLTHPVKPLPQPSASVTFPAPIAVATSLARP
jgi:undecaprenyl-diphosphatase